jgi:hypothetical protein
VAHCYSPESDPATGKRHRVNVTVEGDRKAAEKELGRLLKSVDGVHVDPARITVRELLDRWLEAIRPEVAPTTREPYAEIVSHYLGPALGNLQLAKLAQSISRNVAPTWPKGKFRPAG